jgi:hypothetical protein
MASGSPGCQRIMTLIKKERKDMETSFEKRGKTRCQNRKKIAIIKSRSRLVKISINRFDSVENNPIVWYNSAFINSGIL